MLAEGAKDDYLCGFFMEETGVALSEINDGPDGYTKVLALFDEALAQA